PAENPDRCGDSTGRVLAPAGPFRGGPLGCGRDGTGRTRVHRPQPLLRPMSDREPVCLETGGPTRLRRPTAPYTDVCGNRPTSARPLARRPARLRAPGPQVLPGRGLGRPHPT